MNIKIGLTIRWQDNFGRGDPYESQVKQILIAKAIGNNHEYECERTDMINTEWARLNGKEVIIITDNEKWLFAWQIMEEKKMPEANKNIEICAGCQQPLPMEHVGTAWDYIDGVPICNGCKEIRDQFLSEQERKELH